HLSEAPCLLLGGAVDVVAVEVGRELVQLLPRPKPALWIHGRRRPDKVDAHLRLGTQKPVVLRDRDREAGRMPKPGVGDHLLVAAADLHVVVGWKGGSRSGRKGRL